MKLTINNQPVETKATTLLALTEELLLPATGVAVAVNNRMIPRTEWESHPLTEDLKIIVIKAACGG